MRVQQQFKEEKAQLEAKHQKQVDQLNKELTDKIHTMQEITMQMAMSKQLVHETGAEADKLRGEIKKVEKAKAEAENQVKTMTMVLEKTATDSMMF